jgi:hypothetical protein
MKYSSNDNNVCRVDMIEAMIREEFEKMTIDDPMNRLITFVAEDDFEKFLEH